MHSWQVIGECNRNKIFHPSLFKTVFLSLDLNSALFVFAEMYFLSFNQFQSQPWRLHPVHARALLHFLPCHLRPDCRSCDEARRLALRVVGHLPQTYEGLSKAKQGGGT